MSDARQVLDVWWAIFAVAVAGVTWLAWALGRESGRAERVDAKQLRDEWEAGFRQGRYFGRDEADQAMADAMAALPEFVDDDMFWLGTHERDRAEEAAMYPKDDV